MVNFSLEGKVALVTGAAYGIGFAMAQALAEAGAKIAFNCRTQANMDKALEEYAKLGIEAKGYICDATDEEGVKAVESDLCASLCECLCHCETNSVSCASDKGYLTFE